MRCSFDLAQVVVENEKLVDPNLLERPFGVRKQLVGQRKLFLESAEAAQVAQLLGESASDDLLAQEGDDGLLHNLDFLQVDARLIKSQKRLVQHGKNKPINHLKRPLAKQLDQFVLLVRCYLKLCSFGSLLLRKSIPKNTVSVIKNLRLTALEVNGSIFLTLLDYIGWILMQYGVQFEVLFH